ARLPSLRFARARCIASVDAVAFVVVVGAFDLRASAGSRAAGLTCGVAKARAAVAVDAVARGAVAGHSAAGGDRAGGAHEARPHPGVSEGRSDVVALIGYEHPTVPFAREGGEILVSGAVGDDDTGRVEHSAVVAKPRPIDVFRATARVGPDGEIAHGV